MLNRSSLIITNAALLLHYSYTHILSYSPTSLHLRNQKSQLTLATDPNNKSSQRALYGNGIDFSLGFQKVSEPYGCVGCIGKTNIPASSREIYTVADRYRGRLHLQIIAVPGIEIVTR